MATARGTQSVTLLGMARRNRPALLLGTALQAASIMVLALPAGAQPAPNARPVGGQVVAGSAVISRSPQATTITQSTARAAVNWQKFDVGSQQAVRFAQPSVTASTLNRVTGPDPSQIAGRIQANGQVVLVNQSGVVFYKGAQVDVAGLVVSAAGITNQNFMAGRMVFDQPAHPNARVENHGNITIRQAGLAALVAPQVANSGVISAKLGRVVLAGAVTHTLDMYGDGLVSIDVSGEVRQAPVGPNGKAATALVTNTGTVIAEGGRVLLTARAADGIVQNLVDAGGRVAAPTAGDRTGMVAIQGVGGSIVVTGQLDATGAAPGERGGQVVVNATHGVTLASGAAVNASGRAGGGTVAIGTTLARAAGGKSVMPRLTAKTVVVAKGATVSADATGRGDGGRVTVLSTDSTDMSGAISAKGGPDGGNGGFAEVSGASGFALTGGVDVSAPHGALGTILLDPNDLDVVSEGEVTNVGTVGSANTLEATGSPATVTAGTLEDLGDTGNVELEASGSLGVHTNISVLNGLSLQAGGALIVDPGVAVAAGGNLGMSAGTDLLLGAGGVLSGSNVQLVAAGTAALSGLVQAGNGGTLAVAAKSLDLSAGGQLVVHPIEPDGLGGTVTPGLIQMAADSMALAGGQVVADDGAVAIVPLTLGSTLSLDAATAAGHLSLTPADLKAIQTVGALGANNGPLGAQTLVLGSLDGITASATAGRLEINTGVKLAGSASTLSLFSAGDVVEQGAGAVSVNALTGAAPNGRIMLGGANEIAQIGNQAAVGAYTTAGNFVAGLSGGTIDLTNNGDLRVVAPVIATPGSVGIVVHAGTDTLGTLTNTSTIQAATTTSLTAAQDIENDASVIAGTDATFEAGNDIDNYWEESGNLISAGGNITLQASHDIYNDGTVSAGGNAALSAGNDIENDNSIGATNDVTLAAGHDIYNWYLIDAGRDVHLGATDDIDNYAGVIAGGDAALVAGHDINNFLQEAGISEVDYSGAGNLIQAGNDVVLQATNDIYTEGGVAAYAEGGIAAGRNAALAAGQTVTVAGLVQAGDGGTLTVSGPSLTLEEGGQLVVHPVEPETGGAIVPGLIQLQADAMSLAAGQVIADDGAVAIAPLTAGSTMSFDAATVAGHLSLTQADLAAIQTVGALGANNGPLGTQTLVLGSLDGATASATTGRLEINAGMALGGIASTLSLFSAGDVVEQGAGAVSVNALAGAALNGRIVLGGANTVAQIGGVATTGNFVAGLSGGTIDLTNYGDLAVVAPVIATAGSVGIVVHAGTDTPGTLTNNSTIQGAATVSLAADQDIDNYGSAVAGTDAYLHAAQAIDIEDTVSAVGNTTLVAGSDIYNGGMVSAGGNGTLTASNDIYSYGVIHADNDVTVTAGHDIYNSYLIDAGRDVHLGATDDIDNYASIIAGRNATLVAGHDINNFLQEVGFSETDYLDGGNSIGAGNDVVLHATNDIYTAGDITAGRNGTLAAGQTITVAGLVQAGDGGTLTVAGSSLTLQEGGTLTVNPVEPKAGGTMVPGLIQLQADAMSLAGGQVIADDGAVAIAPLTPDSTLSFDAATVAGHLSLTQADLDAIQTLGALGANNGPLGTQTLVLGSLDGATASATIGRLEINAGMALGGIASTLSLFSAGDVVEQGAGAVSVNALTGAAPNGHVVLNGANAVAQIGSPATAGAFATAGNFASGLSGGTIDVANYRDLSVVGPVIATVGSVGIAVHAGAGMPGTLGNASTIQAAAIVGLSADQDINIAGSVVAGTDAALEAGRDVNNGGRVEAGSDASLVAGQNVGNDGVVHGGNDAGLTAGNDIDNRGLVDTVRDAKLSAQRDIGNGGTVSAGRDTTMAAGTGIVQTGGAILAGESSTGTVTLVGPSITQTGGVIATQPSGGGDMVRLAAAGTDGGAGTIALGGALAASQLVLSASGDIDETGTITAGLLTGTAGIAPGGDLPNGTLGSARLIGATPGANRIATLGAFVTTGSLSVSDGQALTIAGPVMTGVIGAANPQVGGQRFGASIDVPGNSITVAGNLTAGVAAPGAPAGLRLPGGDIALNAGGAIAIPGAIEAAAGANGGGTLTTTAGSSINESGAISAAVLGGGAGGAANFAGDGAASNAIQSLGAFTAGDFALTDGRDLLVAGPVAAGTGSVALTAHAGHGTAGTLTNGAAVAAAGDVSLAADADVRSDGGVTAGQTVAMHAGGTLAVSGPVSAASDVALAAGADLVQTAGAITAGHDAALSAGGSITQQAGGTIRATGGVGLTAGAITLAGAVGAGSAVALNAGTDIVQAAGIVSAGSDAALSAGRDITQQAGGTIAAAQTVSLAAGQAPQGGLGGLTLGGFVSGAAVRLSAPQDIIETGAISAATLSGTAGLAPSAALPDGVLGSATLTGAGPSANRIGTLGSFFTTGSLVVSDGQALTIAGPVTTGAIAAANPDVAGRSFGATITAPAITVSGQLTAGLPPPGASGAALPGGDVALTAGGSIEVSGLLAAQPGSNGGGSFTVIAGAGLHQSGGAVIAGALSGAAGGSVSLDAGQNRIASIGDFTVIPPATGSFRLTDIGDLRLAGTLTSHLIVIGDTAGQITLGDGAGIVTGGIARPDGVFRAPVESDGGAFLTDFVQLGRSTVTGINGGPSILDITALGGGSIFFDSRSSSSGLYAPGTWLVLTLGDPSGTGALGAAKGNVFVKSLDVQLRGSGGQSDLGGTIGNLSGEVAAGSAGISPRMDANYRFNACPIQSVHCVILAVEGLPPGSPLEDLSIAVLADRNGDEDLLLPIISDRDYTLIGGKGDHDLLLPIISDRDY